ncbi:MAG: hypothetical protein U9N62_04810 [Thermotogota bacterium]|nr:hypothetical protein [Thermotogota bacterium]
MIRKVIRLEYAFASGNQKITFEMKECANEGGSFQIEKILTYLELTRDKVSKIELLEIVE